MADNKCSSRLPMSYHGRQARARHGSHLGGYGCQRRIEGPAPRRRTGTKAGDVARHLRGGRLEGETLGRGGGRQPPHGIRPPRAEGPRPQGGGPGDGRRALLRDGWGSCIPRDGERLSGRRSTSWRSTISTDAWKRTSSSTPRRCSTALWPHGLFPAIFGISRVGG